MSMILGLRRWCLVSNKVNIELTGIDKLQKEINELGSKGARVENKALKMAGEHLAERMRVEVPERTGKLKESIEVSGVKTSKGKKKVEVGPTEYYGVFVEKGTSKMQANPFMARSYEGEKKQLQSIIISEIKKGLGLK